MVASALSADVTHDVHPLSDPAEDRVANAVRQRGLEVEVEIAVDVDEELLARTVRVRSPCHRDGPSGVLQESISLVDNRSS